MHLPGEELIRRFLLHVLPKGLMRVRHYGFLANRCRKEKLAKIRECWGRHPMKQQPMSRRRPSKNDWPCPKCHQGRMRVRMVIVADQAHR